MKATRYAIPIATVALGLGLNLVGLIAYSLSEAGKGLTPLIPAFCGGVFLILGGMAIKPNLRPMAIHLALVVALLLGAMTGYMGVAELLDPEGNHRKLFAFLTTAMLCAIYLVIGVRSFIHARQARREADRAVRAAEDARVAG